MRSARAPYRRKKKRLATSAASALAADVRSSTLAHLKPANLDRLAEARRGMTPEEQTLLILRVDRGLAWRDIAVVLAGEGGESGDAEREAALRKRFERLKDKLREKLGRD